MVARRRLAHRKRESPARHLPLDLVEHLHDLEADRIRERVQHVTQLHLVAGRVVKVHGAGDGHYAASRTTGSSTSLTAGGRSTNDTRAEARRATPTATSKVTSNACTYAARAAWARSTLAGPGRAAAACSPAPNDAVAACADAGKSARYSDATTLPMTATPNAPPSSRVVSLTAEPTPALFSGSETMMAPVEGAVTMPMPAAVTTSDSASSG